MTSPFFFDSDGLLILSRKEELAMIDEQELREIESAIESAKSKHVTTGIVLDEYSLEILKEYVNLRRLLGDRNPRDNRPMSMSAVLREIIDNQLPKITGELKKAGNDFPGLDSFLKRKKMQKIRKLSASDERAVA